MTTIEAERKPIKEPSRADFEVSQDGATWQRVDLHLHSPGVNSFTYPDGSDVESEEGRSKVIDKYLKQLAAQKISIGAITDYNGLRMEWFEPIAERAAAEDITLLPGVEVSLKYGKYGLHVLAIFNSDTDYVGLNDFLKFLDRDPTTPLIDSNGAHRDIDPRLNVIEALEDIRERFNCLIILPHPDQKNGFCKSLQTKEAAEFLLSLQPDAVEHCPDAEIRKLQSTNVLPSGFFDYLSFVEFSDPKRIEDIGTKGLSDGGERSTFIKLSANDLGALRLALHDPETRVTIGSVPPPNHARIQNILVSGSGFLGNLSINWNEDLNVLIGGRGAGKSAIIETLRYAFAIESYSDQSYREELVRHALGSGGKVEIGLVRPLGNGQIRKYQISRVLGEPPRVVEIDSQKPVAISPSELLGPNGGPMIFGQREIYAVSQSEEYRLVLLDELIGEEARRRAVDVREAIEKLRGNAREILDCYKKLTKREEYRQRLKAIDHEIGIYEKHGATEKLKDATDLRSDEQLLKGAAGALRKARVDWQDFREDLIFPLETSHRNLMRGQSKQRTILESAAKVLENLQVGLTTLFDKGISLFDSAEKNIQELEKSWKEVLQSLEKEISRIKQEAQTEALDPDRLLKLTEERASLIPLIEDLDRTEAKVKEYLEKRQQLVSNVRDQRHREHRLRREKANEIEEILQSRLLLEVEFKGQKEEYRKQLSSILKGSGVSKDAIDRLVDPEATDGIALAEAVKVGSDEVQEQFNLTSGMANRLIKWISADESRLFELETIIPADALRVRLMIDDMPRSLERLSVGQRATAILLLLFALEGRVLVLDQPEDDLDNRFVYDDIVQILRNQKGLKNGRRRQIIAATHNANIPVIGDAELVLALEAQEGHGYIVGRASIDNLSIRTVIKTIMEGGDEAFKRRAEKYGGLQIS